MHSPFRIALAFVATVSFFVALAPVVAAGTPEQARVAIRRNGNFAGNGVLVAPQWVLTTANLVAPPGTYTVEAGSCVLGSGTVSAVKAIIPFSSTPISPPTYAGDIALIQLAAPLALGPGIQPVSLGNPANSYAGVTATIDGWWVPGCSGAVSPNCQSVNMEVITNTEAAAYWSAANIVDSHIAVYDHAQQTTIWNGSGGAGYFAFDAGNWVLIGISSWGLSGCNKATYPVVGTRITTNYLPWITPWIMAPSTPTEAACAPCWPFALEVQKLVGGTWQHFQSGVAVSQQWVLCAAQNANVPASQLRVVSHDASCTPTIRTVVSYVVHPAFFNNPAECYANGILILNLSSPLPSSVTPVGRLTAPVAAGTNGVMLSAPGNQDGACLEQVDVTVGAHCLTTWGAPANAFAFVNTSGCAGEQGSPILVKNTSGTWELAGIAAWGMGGEVGCSPSVAGLAHDVGLFGAWIASNTNTGNAAPWLASPDCADACGCGGSPCAGLLGHWTMEPVSAADLLHVQDVTNGNSGQLVNGAALTFGPTGTTLALDGIDDYVNVPDNNVLDIGASTAVPGSGDLTLAARIRAVPPGVSMIILDKRLEISGPITGYSLQVFQGRLLLQLADGGTFSNWTSTANVADNQWHCVAVTVDRNSATGIHFYVDGALVADPPMNPTARAGSLANALPLRIGRRSDSPDPGYFLGNIDEVAVFARELCDKDVQALCAGACGPASAWQETCGALAGAAGFPHLEGLGSLGAGAPSALSLTGARASASCALFAALDGTPVPFKGGTLCAFPWSVSPIPFVTSPTGTLLFPFTWSGPSGLAITYQFVIKDAAAVSGLALSNGVKGTTP